MQYFLIAILGLALTSPVNAAIDTTAQDIALLPPYCDAKMGRQAPDAVAMWLDRMGRENWVHLHHYCGGLIEINRYYAGTKGRQKANLGNAVKEFKYVLDRWTPDFYLRAEAHLNQGRAYKFMRQDGLALVEFQKARELNPRLAPASLELADFYVKSGKKQEALSVLKSAIESNPDTKSLRRRYAELGGDMSALPVAAPPSVSVAPHEKSGQEVAPIPDATPSTQESKASTADEPVAQRVEPAIGSPTNPYCRFCPD